MITDAILLVVAVASLLIAVRLSAQVAVIPVRMRRIVEDEIGRARREDEARASSLLSGIRAFHDEIAAGLRRQAAEAEGRARLAERTASDVSTALDAAMALVRELRAIQERAEASARRPSRTAPSIAPPGSATVLAPEPAQVAAGLGPRPTSRPLSASATPHPPPVKMGAATRAATLIGIPAPLPASAQPPSTKPPRSGAGDPDDWMHVERPSDVDGERTRVGPRPPPEAFGASRPALHTAPTLPSMRAIAAQDRGTPS